MSEPRPFRRRIDRVTSGDYLDDLADLPSVRVREMRDECREEEARLSYARRLLHGQLDIARAELERRGDAEATPLVGTLSAILADRGERTTRSAANTSVFVPDGPTGRRRGDRVLEEIPLGRMPDLDDAELAEAVDRLREEEATISRMRRTVMDHLDRLQQELITRYRDGNASIDEVVRGTAG